jgi:hypothetical protein
MIRIDLTPEQRKAASSGHISLTPEEARRWYAAIGAGLRKVTGSTGGRPKALAPCRKCGAMMGARERIAHEPQCMMGIE